MSEEKRDIYDIIDDCKQSYMEFYLPLSLDSAIDALTLENEALRADKAELVGALDSLNKNKLTYEDESGILRVTLGHWASAMVVLASHTKEQEGQM
ncbi:MAG: hypothetical protein COA78_25240 [Blastopirellula sp.]|nr:MAG: hypothetical protein COA78_25240 [Blastopirellula sp.]